MAKLVIGSVQIEELILEEGEQVTILGPDPRIVSDADGELIVSGGERGDPPPPPPPDPDPDPDPQPPPAGGNWLSNGYLMDAAGNPSFAFWQQSEGFWFNTAVNPTGGLHRPIPDWESVFSGVYAPQGFGAQCDRDYLADGSPRRTNTWPEGDVQDEMWTEVENPPAHSSSLTLRWVEGHHLSASDPKYLGESQLFLEGKMDGDTAWSPLFIRDGCLSAINTGHPDPRTPGPDLPAVYLETISLGSHGAWDKYRLRIRGRLQAKGAGFIWSGFYLTGV